MQTIGGMVALPDPGLTTEDIDRFYKHKYPDTDYTESYRNHSKEAEFFQDCISLLLTRLGYPLCNFASLKFQYALGENVQGWEIKLDKHCNRRPFEKTRAEGCLWIELGEKKDESRDGFINSGVFRLDNTIKLLIGNYFQIWVFSIDVARAYVDLHYPDPNYKLQHKTSVGCAMPFEDADRNYEMKLVFPPRDHWLSPEDRITRFSKSPIQGYNLLHG